MNPEVFRTHSFFTIVAERVAGRPTNPFYPQRERPASFLVRAYTKRHYGHDLRLLSEKAGVVSTNQMLTLERLIAGARKSRPVPTPTAQSCGLESVPSAFRIPPLPCLRPYPDNVTNFARNSVTGAPHYKRNRFAISCPYLPRD